MQDDVYAEGLCIGVVYTCSGRKIDRKLDGTIPDDRCAPASIPGPRGSDVGMSDRASLSFFVSNSKQV
jgi:hypothetical protein